MVSQHRVIGPIFFEESVNEELYHGVLMQFQHLARG
jgi:hypothetical protein